MESRIINNYTVYEDGTVISKNGIEIKWYENGRGYLITRLLWDGKWRTKALHTVVCEAFHGARPDGYEAGHLDGNSYNNHSDNLEWITKSQNRKQSYEDGRYVGCDSNANARLTNEDVHLICKILESNEYKSISSLSREIGVARETLSQIKNHRQWVDISKYYNF